MSDADIIKVLECCKMPVGSGACKKCPLKNIRNNLHKEDIKSCTTTMIENALDLINRQKAEIVELQHKIESCNEQIDALENEMHTMVEFQMEV